MPANYKVLGQQVAAAAAAFVTLYTVPAATQAIASTLSICNTGAAAVTYRVSVRPAGAAQANKHYIVFNAALNPGDSILLTLGITLAATDVVSVSASTVDVAFSLFGTEIS